MKRLFLSLLVLVLLLTGCGNKATVKKPADKTPSDAQTGEPTPELPKHAVDEDLFIANAYYRPETPPFSLPGTDFQLEEKNDEQRYLTYTGVTQEKMDAYFRQLEQEGFTKEDRDYSTAFSREDCVIHIDYGTKSAGRDYIDIYYYAQRPALPEGALTQQQAQERMKKEYLPIDITPDGLFQRSGFQIFVCLAPEDAWRTFYVGIVASSHAWLATMEPIAVTDLDENGIDEVWSMGYGGSSGLFTFYVRAIENEEVKYIKTVRSEYYKLSFDGESGYLRIRGIPQDSEEIVYIDLDISSGQLELIKDGEALPAWGN